MDCGPKTAVAAILSHVFDECFRSCRRRWSLRTPNHLKLVAEP